MYAVAQLQTIDPSIWVLLLFAAALAGFMDAVVGGGGMIQVPAMFTALPNAIPAQILGTNKLASIFGTGAAAIEYIKKIKLPFKVVLIACTTGCIAAFLGAISVSLIPVEQFKKALPIVLLALLVYVLLNKQLGLQQNTNHKTKYPHLIAAISGAVIGFYDGVFGPGTGSFLILVWVRFFNYEFLKASAVAKIVNLACNLGALFWFSYSGVVIYQISLIMALCNIIGAVIGSRFAMRKGSVFVRRVFIAVVFLLIVKTSYGIYY